MQTQARIRILALALLIFPLCGCLFRTHKVQPRTYAGTLQTASRENLVGRLNAIANTVKFLNATVDIATSVGGEKKGKVTEYQEIRGYFLVRQPDMLRLIGLLPVVRTRAFDMVSDGKQFKLWIPPKNKFYVGPNNVTHPSNNPLENMRPQIFRDALLLNPIDENEIAVLEPTTEMVTDPKSHKEVEQPDYTLIIIVRDNGKWYLERKVSFSRTDLQPRHQVIYDRSENIASDIRYDKFEMYDNLYFPTVIQIWRPQEEYAITMGIVKMTVNQPLTDEQFALVQPPGSQLVPLNGNAETLGHGDK
jgi:hypothetical protein